MIIMRKVMLRAAPPLKGSEIAVWAEGKATSETDGFTFVISRIALSSSSTYFTVEWGDGDVQVLEATITDLSHTYLRPGLYRIRISDDVSNIRVSSGVDSISSRVYAPMIREFRSTAQKMTAIPRIAFRNASNLQWVDLRGSAIVSLGGSAFEDCRSLRSLEGCAEVTQLGMSTFNGCSGLSGRVDLPELEQISASTVNSSPFLNTGINEFHFSLKNEEKIRSSTLFVETSGNFGVDGAVSFFDL